MEIAADVLSGMIAHAREEAPLECCGLLVGRGDRVECGVRARNARASMTRYLVHPEDHFAAIKQSRAEGRSILGAYHSHLHSAPVPSATDVAEAHDSELAYVIVSLMTPGQPDVRAYRIRDGHFVPIPLVAVP